MILADLILLWSLQEGKNTDFSLQISDRLQHISWYCGLYIKGIYQRIRKFIFKNQNKTEINILKNWE